MTTTNAVTCPLSRPSCRNRRAALTRHRPRRTAGQDWHCQTAPGRQDCRARGCPGEVPSFRHRGHSPGPARRNVPLGSPSRRIFSGLLQDSWRSRDIHDQRSLRVSWRAGDSCCRAVARHGPPAASGDGAGELQAGTVTCIGICPQSGSWQSWQAGQGSPDTRPRRSMPSASSRTSRAWVRGWGAFRIAEPGDATAVGVDRGGERGRDRLGAGDVQQAQV
jgi:hypothetical protein